MAKHCGSHSRKKMSKQTMNCGSTPKSAAVITISTAISTSSTAVMSSSTAVITSSTAVISSSTAVTPDRSDTEACHKYGLEHLRIERERMTNLHPAPTLDFALKLDEVQLRLSKLRRIHEPHRTSSVRGGEHIYEEK